MKRKLCIIACAIFVLGFSGIANAGKLYIVKQIQPKFRPVVYNNEASGDRHLNTAGFRKFFIPGLQAIKNFYLKNAPEHRDQNGLWYRSGYQTMMPGKKKLSFDWIKGINTKLTVFNLNYAKWQMDHSVKNAAPVPEPGTILLMGIGLVGLAGYGRRRIIKH